MPQLSEHPGQERSRRIAVWRDDHLPHTWRFAFDASVLLAIHRSPGRAHGHPNLHAAAVADPIHDGGRPGEYSFVTTTNRNMTELAASTRRDMES